MNEVESKRFLERFEHGSRSLIMNQFCHAVRSGNTTVGTILRWVQHDADKRIAQNPDQRESQKILIANLSSEEARELAEYTLWWESLSFEEKDRIKKERGVDYRKQYMESQPPTEKQLSYLRSLGCETVPQSKYEASRLIDGLAKKCK